MRPMKKILTALLTTALLASVSGCQTAPPDSEPAQQTLMVKAEPAPTTDQAATNIIAALNHCWNKFQTDDIHTQKIHQQKWKQ